MVSCYVHASVLPNTILLLSIATPEVPMEAPPPPTQTKIPLSMEKPTKVVLLKASCVVVDVHTYVHE